MRSCETSVVVEACKASGRYRYAVVTLSLRCRVVCMSRLYRIASIRCRQPPSLCRDGLQRPVTACHNTPLVHQPLATLRAAHTAELTYLLPLLASLLPEMCQRPGNSGVGGASLAAASGRLPVRDGRGPGDGGDVAGWFVGGRRAGGVRETDRRRRVVPSAPASDMRLAVLVGAHARRCLRSARIARSICVLCVQAHVRPPVHRRACRSPVPRRPAT